jgi:hypothetical protein
MSAQQLVTLLMAAAAPAAADAAAAPPLSDVEGAHDDDAAPSSSSAIIVAAPASAWDTSRAHAALVHVMRLLPLDARARGSCVCRAWRDAAADDGVRVAK